MRGTSGVGPQLAAIGMPLLAFRRDNGTKKLRVILPRICRLSKPADYCHSNKCPLWVSAMDKIARSLHTATGRVNDALTAAGAIAGLFRKGSGWGSVVLSMAPSRAGSLPHLIPVMHKICAL